MLSVDFLSEAQRDFDESFDWYAARSVQIAVRFADAIESALKTIVTDPERFASVDNIHRQCPINRFPFRIIFRSNKKSILVVAVAHAKRRPGYWQERE